jgi:hypothetical protein
MGYTDLQKRTEIARELGIRRRMFPLMVARGQITQDEAEAWIDILTAIWHDYDEPEIRRQRQFEFEDG